VKVRNIAVLLGFAASAFCAAAETFPDRPILIAVGFPVGQASESKSGAGGIISHELVRNSPVDGYTILMGSSGPLAINPRCTASSLTARCAPSNPSVTTRRPWWQT
jgi:tripartite-type tricarboxylate transporter receptor subunit TctC